MARSSVLLVSVSLEANESSTNWKLGCLSGGGLVEARLQGKELGGCNCDAASRKVYDVKLGGNASCLQHVNLLLIIYNNIVDDKAV